MANNSWYWLMGWGMLIDGVVRILTLGIVRPSLAYQVVMRKLHYEMKQREKETATKL